MFVDVHSFHEELKIINQPKNTKCGGLVCRASLGGECTEKIGAKLNITLTLPKVSWTASIVGDVRDTAALLALFFINPSFSHALLFH